MDINSNFLGDDLNSHHSSGAGKVEHFSEVFEKTDVEAALAAGIFHREEVPIEAVKEHAYEGKRIGDALNSDSISAH